MGATVRCRAIGGSDSHALHEVGTAATEFDAEIRNLTDLIEALRSGGVPAGGDRLLTG